MRGSYHWIGFAGRVVLLGPHVDATSCSYNNQTLSFENKGELRYVANTQVNREHHNIYIYVLQNFQWSLQTNKLVFNGVIQQIC